MPGADLGSSRGFPGPIAWSSWTAERRDGGLHGDPRTGATVSHACAQDQVRGAVLSSFIERLEDDRLGVVAAVDGGRPLLIAFGGRALKLGMPPFEFVRLTRDIPADVVFVRDLSQSFYHRGIPELGRTFPEIAGSLSEWVASSPRSVFVGNSAGGYAALILGSLCGATRVLAFSPLTFLDRFRRIVHHDHRRRSTIDAINRGPECQRSYLDARPIVAAHPAVRTDIHFASQNRVDRTHGRRMGRLQNVQLHPYQGRDHNVIVTMRDSGKLRSELESTLFGDSD